MKLGQQQRTHFAKLFRPQLNDFNRERMQRLRFDEEKIDSVFDSIKQVAYWEKGLSAEIRGKRLDAFDKLFEETKKEFLGDDSASFSQSRSQRYASQNFVEAMSSKFEAYHYPIKRLAQE